MTCKDCIYAVQPTTTMRCRNHSFYVPDNAVVCDEFRDKPQTNADRIRAMTDEEMAVFLGKAVAEMNEYPPDAVPMTSAFRWWLAKEYKE